VRVCVRLNVAVRLDVSVWMRVRVRVWMRMRVRVRVRVAVRLVGALLDRQRLAVDLGQILRYHQPRRRRIIRSGRK